MPSRRALAVGLIAAACVIPVALTPTSAQNPGGHASEINRRLERWQTEPALSPYTQGVPAPMTSPGPLTLTPQPAAPVTGRTKIAFCYGVNEVDPAFYGGPNRLGACENDAKALSEVAIQLGFQTKIRLTRQATSANLFADLRAAAAQLRAGDCLIVTYAGHGSTVRDENGDEKPNTEDQTWCLYDRMVIDDELGEAWTQFQPGVRIYVVADSCHSGTSTRALSRGANTAASLASPGARALTDRNNSGDFKVSTLFPDAQRQG